ncbi:MAG TPA: hypothetical protein VFF73_26655 [Planctomycetota bacterium]|nr:hypothetical protein [Planctomycetota bacterium]
MELDDDDAEDDSFCRIAVSLGFLTDEKAAVALEAQRLLGRPQRIGMILVGRRLMTPGQVDEVLRVQVQRRSPAPEPEEQQLLLEAARLRLFGKLVILRGLATQGEVEECIFHQRQLADQGERLRIGEVMVNKGYLTTEDVLALLELQQRADLVARPETAG